MLSVAKSLLADAGIRSTTKGEGVQDLFGLGRAGTGYNVLAGPVELQVMREDEETAKALLDEHTKSAGEPMEFEEEDASDDDTSRSILSTARSAWWRRLIWLAPSILAAVWILVVVVGSERSDRPSPAPVVLPPSAFAEDYATEIYRAILLAEGVSNESELTIVSARPIAARDSVILEEWTVSRGDDHVYYPVYAYLRADSLWHLRVGESQKNRLTVSWLRRDEFMSRY